MSSFICTISNVVIIFIYEQSMWHTWNQHYSCKMAAKASIKACAFHSASAHRQCKMFPADTQWVNVQQTLSSRNGLERRNSRKQDGQGDWIIYWIARVRWNDIFFNFSIRITMWTNRFWKNSRLTKHPKKLLGQLIANMKREPVKMRKKKRKAGA